MKMLEITRCAAGVLAVVLSCGLYGCSPSVEPPDSSLFANAQADYQAGNYDPAIAGFERVLQSNPKHHLAHYQLAIALQEKKRDYLGAIIHYSLYLKFRPEDDKTPHAEERLRICKTRLVEELRQGGDASASKAASSDDGKELAEKNNSLSADIKNLQTENAALRVKNESLTTMLAKLEAGLDPSSCSAQSDKTRVVNLKAEAKKVLAEMSEPKTKVTRRSLINPTDKELLEDDSDDGPSFSSSEVKSQIAQAKAEDESVPALPPAIKKPPLIINSSSSSDSKPVPSGVQGGGKNVLTGGSKKPSGSERPATYKVQHGDGLQAIAKRFYGNPAKWRDIQRANMDTIPADGRVKAGQVIKLP